MKSPQMGPICSGEYCGIMGQPDFSPVLTDLGALSPDEMRSMLSRLAGMAPHAFERALYHVSKARAGYEKR